MRNEISEKVLRFSCPLYAVVNGKHGIAGSGLLVASENNSYLVTAGHVDVHRGDIMLYGESKISPLGDFIILPNAVDITVVEVTNASYFLDFGFEFLPLDQWGINHPLRPREDAPNYLVLGYPHTKTRKEVFGRKSDSVPFGFWTRLYGSEELQILGCDELTELALRFIPTKLYDERLALHHRAPDLQGMSGCGIWDTAGLEPILVGVLLEQRPVTTPLSLIATRIDAISEVLRGIGDTSIPMSRRLAVDVDFRQITVL